MYNMIWSINKTFLSLSDVLIMQNVPYQSVIKAYYYFIGLLCTCKHRLTLWLVNLEQIYLLSILLRSLQ